MQASTHFIAFRPWGRVHGAALLVIFAITVGLPLGTLRLHSARMVEAVAIGLGCVLLASELCPLIWYGSQGVPWGDLLPLDLCDLTVFTTAAALFLRRPFLYELAYFWGMGGTLQALLTPELQNGFPSLDFWFFFVPHGMVMVGVIYATAVLGLRPWPRSILRVFLCTAALAVLVTPVDWLLHANYLFLCRKPEAASLLNYLGPWPWYLLSLVPVTLAFLVLGYLPFWWKDRWARTHGAKTGAARVRRRGVHPPP